MLDQGSISLAAGAAILVALAGAIVWALTFFAWSAPTEKRLDELESTNETLVEQLQKIGEDLAFVRGRLEKK